MESHLHAGVAELLTWVDGFMVFNATFNNISVISWQSALLVEETRVPRENNIPGNNRSYDVKIME
jgi:hypothetical protein